VCVIFAAIDNCEDFRYMVIGRPFDLKML